MEKFNTVNMLASKTLVNVRPESTVDEFCEIKVILPMISSFGKIKINSNAI